MVSQGYAGLQWWHEGTVHLPRLILALGPPGCVVLGPCHPCASVSSSVKWGPWQGHRKGPCAQRSEQCPELASERSCHPRLCYPLHFANGGTEAEDLSNRPEVTELTDSPQSPRM